MIEKWIEMYEQGGITANHLAGEAMNLLDPGNPGPILRTLPRDVLPYLHRQTVEYQPGRMLSNYGSLPTTLQVEAAKRWIEANVPADQLEVVARA